MSKSKVQSWDDVDIYTTLKGYIYYIVFKVKWYLGTY